MTRPASRPPWAWRLIVGAVTGFMRVLFGWRVQARFPSDPPPPERPLVMVLNHTSNVDAFFVADMVWRGLGHWGRPLAKAELFELPVIGTLGRLAGGIPVRRTDDDAREHAYGAAVEAMADGASVILAPEGTITHDGRLLPLRHGAARLALEAGADVLVVTHFGAQRGYSPAVTLPERDVVVSMAVDVLSPTPDEDADELTGRIAATMLDRLEELQERYPQADPDAPWWPPYRSPGRPTEVARENIERYRASMAEAVASARARMADSRAEHFTELARHRLEELSARVRERMTNAPHLRVARPSPDPERTAAFYRDVLGFTELDRFDDHDGFDGILLGHPGWPWHLELVREHGVTHGGSPDTEHLLVLYLPDADDHAAAVAAARGHGHEAVPAGNPYWDRHGVTFEDPDGYRVVLAARRWPA